MLNLLLNMPSFIKHFLILPSINATYIYKLDIFINISTLKLECVHILARHICATLTHLRTWTYMLNLMLQRFKSDIIAIFIYIFKYKCLYKPSTTYGQN